MSDEERKNGPARATSTRPARAGSSVRDRADSAGTARPGSTGTSRTASPGPARLFALAAGGFLALLGVVGFFYDAQFGTGTNLADDDLAGVLVVNGWRNVVYLATGMLALGFAPRWPRPSALALGLLYLVYAIWGFEVTERGIGSILDTLPLGNEDNALHLVVGALGLGTALIDGPLPEPRTLRPGAWAKRSRGSPGERATGGREAARRSP